MMSLTAEGSTEGFVRLSPEEAVVVQYALDIRNWRIICSESWSGSCFIWVKNPLPVRNYACPCVKHAVVKGNPRERYMDVLSEEVLQKISSEIV